MDGGKRYGCIQGKMTILIMLNHIELVLLTAESKMVYMKNGK